MQSAIAQVGKHVKEHHFPARLLFDTGAHRSFITQDMRHKLKLKTQRKELLNVSTFGKDDSKSTSYGVVMFNLQTRDEDINVTALVTKTICPSLTTPKNIQLPAEFKSLELADTLFTAEERQIDILIGNDYYSHLITGNTKISQDENFMATESKFGWLLSGTFPQIPSNNNQPSIISSCAVRVGLVEEERLDDLLTKFWEINEIPQQFNTSEEDDVTEKFLQTIHFDQRTGIYKVRIPWKTNKNELPTNLELSKRRLRNRISSLKKKDPTLIKRYNNQLMDQLKLGFIEQVQEPTQSKTIHYIPHFPVFKDDSATTKMRIVYDASAKMSPDSLCLNDCLHTGPNLIKKPIQHSDKIPTTQYSFHSRHRKSIPTNRTPSGR